MKMGSTLSLALSESNTKSGHHYIIPEGYKFKLVWTVVSSQYNIMISFHSVTDETYPALSKDWSCGFNISLNNTVPQTITVIDGREDKLVAFKCGDYVTAPILYIRTVPALAI